MNILVIFTCFNRKDKTAACIKTLTKENPDSNFSFIAVDDGSTDGTKEILRELSETYAVHLIEGTGSLFYSGGMRVGMEYALQQKKEFDYLLMVNDDVEFLPLGVEKMIEQSIFQKNAVIVGAMKNTEGEMSYGAMKYRNGTVFERVGIESWETDADTFNANCVLIPYIAFQKAGAIDKNYIHSLGDFDYGLQLKRLGYKIHVSKDFIGICNNNSKKGTWGDKSLSRRERIKKKESPKGAPTKQWFYFLKKNFGLPLAIRGAITPYIRILLGL